MPSCLAEALSASQPLRTPSLTNSIGLHRQPFAVESAAAKAPLAKRVVVDGDAAREYLFAKRIEQETRLAGDGAAADCAHEMPKQGGGDARIEQDGHHARLDPDRVEPGNGAGRGAGPDVDGVFEVRLMARAVPGIVALHRGPFPRHYAGGATIAGGAGRARKAMARRDGERRSRCRSAAAVGIGDALHGTGSILGGERPSRAAGPDRDRRRRRGRGRRARRGTATLRAPGPHRGLPALLRPSRGTARPAQQAHRGTDRTKRRSRSSGPRKTRRPISSPSLRWTSSSAPSLMLTPCERSPT